MNDGFKGKNYEIHAYNGGLFKADPLLDDLNISDDVLEMHVLKLTEYDFDTEVDTNILGHIFEHSLNDIENVRAELAGEELDKSKTKRKKDGVFYTPKYITKYIVDNTVGKLCEEKKAEIGIDEEEFTKDRKGRRSDTLKKLDEQLKQYRDWLLQLTICDPACGSGAFLNQTLEFLMAEHRYVDELESQLLGYAMVFQDVENHILERNIFGVDINEESVEIARLSLWLRTAQKGRTLTSLSDNIKVGNSLIDDPEVAGKLAFNWQEQFPKVFEKGGFDVVIGNPPYVRHELISEYKPFYKKRFKTYAGTADLYTYFIEIGVNELINPSGYYSVIVANKWMRARFGKPLRHWLRTQALEEIIDFKDLPVFHEASTYPCILTVKGGRKSRDEFSAFEPESLGFSDLQSEVRAGKFAVSISQLDDEGWSLVSADIANIMTKLKSTGVPLSEKVNDRIYRGVLTGLNEAFVIDEETKDKACQPDSKSLEVIKPFLAGRDVKRYEIDFQYSYLIFTRRGVDIDSYPAIRDYLETYRDRLKT